MLQKLRARNVEISRRRDQADLITLFIEDAIIEVLQFINNTEVEMKLARDANKSDSQDIERLDRSEDEANGTLEDGRG